MSNGNVTVETDWYTYHDKVTSLAHFLDLQDYFIGKNPVWNVIYFFEKPWKYEREYYRYLQYLVFIDDIGLDYGEDSYWKFVNYEKDQNDKR